MGCASSKKKTTSVEDLNADQKQPGGVTPKKNGQVTSNDAKVKGGGDAIQIPGAHTSFMAPDGIPFIDEDVDEDAAETRGTAVVANAKPDVNRNVVEAEVQSKQAPTVSAERPTSVGEKSEEQKKAEIRDEIMKREMEITQSSSTGMYY